MNKLKTKLGNLKLENPLMNASGVNCTAFEELIELAESNLGAMITKTSSSNPRYGNPKPRYFDDDKLSINSMGLPNNGFEFYLSASSKSRISQHSKPYVISLSCLDIKETIDIIDRILSGDEPSLRINAIEINLSCPNVIGKGQIAYDFDNLPEIINKLLNPVYKYQSNSVTGIPIGFKLPPYFDQDHIRRVFNILEPDLQKGGIQFLTLINSPGNCLVIDPEKETTVIHPKKGLGGLGGIGIKPIALANVWQFHNHLKEKDLLDKVTLIGCGGIRNGTDVYEHLLAGASLVQIGTQIKREGVEKSTNRILKELDDLLTRKGKIVEDVVGRLKVIKKIDQDV